MLRVGYFSPFVPPEWIAAHGLSPEWMTLTMPDTASLAAHRGTCPCAGALVAQMRGDTALDALVLTTVCDQLRYAAAHLQTLSEVPTFLLNVPSTWQSDQVRRLYRDELERLSRFLVQVGGHRPTQEHAAETIRQYDGQRRPSTDPIVCDEGTVPLALIGGPLASDGAAFLAAIAQAGGCIVLDATEGGERTRPAAVDRGRLTHDPVEELVRIYFDTIPDAFRRPNTLLYEWLGRQMAARSVRGVIVRRYPFCDLWHAEVHRLREWSPVPVLDVDVAVGDEGESSRNQSRIEAFLEMLR